MHKKAIRFIETLWPLVPRPFLAGRVHEEYVTRMMQLVIVAIDCQGNHKFTLLFRSCNLLFVYPPARNGLVNEVEFLGLITHDQ